jgi:signal transduction histidine kinase
MAGMRERAAMIGGKLDVQTAVDYGTVVILELPR